MHVLPHLDGFEWNQEHTESVRKLLTTALALKKVVYGKGTPVYITVDTSPTGIGWVVNQEDEDGIRFPIRFGAKVLSERQRGYAQVKRELWGIVSAVKADKDYLIGISSKNGMLMCGMRSLRTLFIAFTMCTTELVPPC